MKTWQKVLLGTGLLGAGYVTYRAVKAYTLVKSVEAQGQKFSGAVDRWLESDDSEADLDLDAPSTTGGAWGTSEPEQIEAAPSAWGYGNEPSEGGSLIDRARDYIGEG